MTTATGKPPGEAVFSWAMVLFGAFVTWQASGIGDFDSPSAAGVFPLAAGLAMTLAALVAAAGATRRAAGASTTGTVLTLDVAAIGVLVLGYMLALEAIGFVLSSLIFLLLAIAWLQRGGWLRATIVSVVSVGLVWVVFRLVFHVVLPTGWLLA